MTPTIDTIMLLTYITGLSAGAFIGWFARGAVWQIIEEVRDNNE